VVLAGFALIVGVPFALGVGAMALPVPRFVKVGLALAPVAAFALLAVSGFFWLGDVGAPLLMFVSVWGWLLGVALSADIRSAARAAIRLVHA
jgi:hypothetical protein